MQLNIPPYLHPNLSAKVSDFIVNGQWNFPSSVLMDFLVIKHLADQIIISVEDFDDKLVWRASSNGDISFKEAFLFKYGAGQNVQRAKT